jgi:hypothetical protein
VDGRWPSMMCVEQLFPRTLAEVPNDLLSDPILEMGVDAAEGKPLICARTCSFEVVVDKSTIVAMIMQYFDAVLIWQGTHLCRALSDDVQGAR